MVNLRLLTLLVLFLNVMTSHAQQQVDGYLEKLKSTKGPDEFNTIIHRLEELSRKDSILLTDEQFKSIIHIAEKSSFTKRILPDVYRWVGLRYANGRMDEAIIYFLESTTLYAKQKKRLAEALSCFEIGLIHHKAKNFDQAKEFYNKALFLARDSLDHRAVINCYNGIGLINREDGKYPEAIAQFRKALQVAVDDKDLSWIGILEGNIGSIYLRRGDYDSSIFYYKKNLSDIRKTQEVENEIETYINIGKVYIRKKEYKKALVYLDSSLYVINTRKITFTDFFNPLDEINESYAWAYAGMGDYKKAFNYYHEFFTLEEAKEFRLKGLSLSQLQATYNFKQKQSELDLLHQINAANQTIIIQQRYGQVALLGVIILLAGMAFFAYRTSSQRKKLNEKLGVANLELERMNHTKDKLFSVVSHDLRGPLLNLHAILQMLNAGHIKQEEFSDFSKKINQQLLASRHTLDNLLQWAKSQLSDVKMKRELILVSRKIDQVIHTFEEEARRKNITLTNSVSVGVTVLVDGNQLQIMLRNLIGNALKFSNENGCVLLSAQRLDGFVEIIVEDNGIGISEEDQKRLFQPGQQFSRMGTHEEKGTGIGLVITREMILANGGTIRVESEKDKGSRFIFALPVSIK